MENLTLDDKSDSVTDSTVCANNGDYGGKVPCDKRATNVCGSCGLVQYCGRVCQKSHWPIHKRICKSTLLSGDWLPRCALEGTNPNMNFDTKRRFFLGNMPAIDISKLHEDECKPTNEPFRLLFGASGDLRNVIKSVVGLPSNLARPVEIFINDMDDAVVARNVILLLIALTVEDEDCEKMMIHIWYSCVLPKKMLEKVQTYLFPLIEEGCSAPHGRAPNGHNGKSLSHPDNVRVEWTRSRGTMAVSLTRRGWKKLQAYLKPPEPPLGAKEARKARLTAIKTPEMSDSLDMWICRQPAKWRASYAEFRRDGVLLPYSHPRKDFDTPNPTFFLGKSYWPKIEPCDPLWGWNIGDIVPYAKPAQNDLYGGLYCYLKDLFRLFVKRLNELSIRFECYCKDVGDEKLESIMVDYVDCWDAFDRIETSNLADPDYFGPRTTLLSFAWLLRPHAANPHATLFTLNMQLTGLNAHPSSFQAAQTAVAKRRIARLLASSQAAAKAAATAPPAGPARSNKVLDRFREKASLKLVANTDYLFRAWKEVLQRIGCFDDTPVRMRPAHRIVKRWPMRLEKDATGDDFDRLCVSGNRGCEWYIEWERTPESGNAFKVMWF